MEQGLWASKVAQSHRLTMLSRCCKRKPACTSGQENAVREEVGSIKEVVSFVQWFIPCLKDIRVSAYPPNHFLSNKFRFSVDQNETEDLKSELLLHRSITPDRNLKHHKLLFSSLLSSVSILFTFSRKLLFSYPHSLVLLLHVSLSIYSKKDRDLKIFSFCVLFYRLFPHQWLSPYQCWTPPRNKLVRVCCKMRPKNILPNNITSIKKNPSCSPNDTMLFLACC